METEEKNQLKQSAQAIAEAMAKWERVRDIAEDIVGFIERDARRFKIGVEVAVGTRVIYAYLAGAEQYIMYGEGINEKTLRQILEEFFNDSKALVNMVRALAEAIDEIANQNIKELEKQTQ